MPTFDGDTDAAHEMQPLPVFALALSLLTTSPGLILKSEKKRSQIFRFNKAKPPFGAVFLCIAIIAKKDKPRSKSQESKNSNKNQAINIQILQTNMYATKHRFIKK